MIAPSLFKDKIGSKQKAPQKRRFKIYKTAIQ
jgi:hypothetical protein